MPKYNCKNAGQHFHDGYEDGYFDGIETDTRNDCCRECLQAYDLGFEQGADDAVSETLPNIVCTGLATPESDSGSAQNASR
jgi:hypothetical protein